MTWHDGTVVGRVFYAGGTDVPVADGGTGLSTIAAGRLLYASALDTFAGLAPGAAGTFVRSDGTNPTYSTLTIPNTLAINTLLYASAADVLAAMTAGTASQTLRVPGAGGAPAFGALDLAAAAAITGLLPNANLDAVGPGATGPIGSATVAPVVTINAQGRVTALTSATIAAGAVTRVGGNTTEATTTSTTTVSLVTVSGLSIAAATPVLVVGSYRKTTGAVDTVNIGLTLNTTEVMDPAGASGSQNEVQTGIFIFFVGAHDGVYLRSGFSIRQSDGATGGIDGGGGLLAFRADIPNASITDIIIRAAVSNAAITLAVDEVHVYTFATR